MAVQYRLVGMKAATPGGTARAEDPGLSVAKEAAEAVPPESVRRNGNQPLLFREMIFLFNTSFRNAKKHPCRSARVMLKTLFLRLKQPANYPRFAPRPPRFDSVARFKVDKRSSLSFRKRAIFCSKFSLNGALSF